MVPALKSEFKKLFSIRSTYGWVLLALVLVGIYAFYGEGFKDASNIIHTANVKHGVRTGTVNLFIAGTITQLAGFVGLFGGIIALLLITHEYRYNTITYTLAASNSRSKVLISKILAIFGFVLAYSILLTLYGLGMIFLGLHFAHNHLPHQEISYLTYFGKVLFHSQGEALVGLLLGVLIRNQVGSFAALFILPGPVQGLLSLILRHDSIYMPFLALDQVIQSPSLSPPGVNEASTGYLSPAKGALVFIVWLVFGWIVGWYLFLRRDAN